jgi:hypothetical protein
MIEVVSLLYTACCDADLKSRDEMRYSRGVCRLNRLVWCKFRWSLIDSHEGMRLSPRVDCKREHNQNDAAQ